MSPAPQAARPAGRLPLESTGFVGRQAELATLGTLLGKSRLVTVTGPGGVGKTRLALRYAAKAAAGYSDGAVLIELSGLRQPDLLAHSVASALGLSQLDGHDPLSAVIGHLRERELLLVLDTCEHLIDACAVLAEGLLRETPGVTILATSRQPLDVPGESTCPLSPLRVPRQGSAPGTGDAVELFAQRAAAAIAGFQVTGANRDQVIRLCEQLEGVPLAIELAAVRLRAFGLGELTRRLDQRLLLLAGGRRTLSPRHQALRDTIGWSYDLCTPGEQTLWARLSVFAGPFTVDAAEEACGGGALPREDVLDTLISLVDKSVVGRNDGPVPSYRMLDTIREYGDEKLSGTGTASEVQLRVIKHYLRLAEDLNADPLTRQLHKYQTLRTQHASVTAALDGSFALAGQERLAARTTMAGYWYVVISGSFQEARYYLTKALERFPAPSPERAGLLAEHGLLVTVQGDPESGLAQCKEGLELAAALGETRLRARSSFYYCQALLAAGRLPEALATGQTARDLMTEAGDTATAEALWLFLGAARLLDGKINECSDSCGEGLRRMRAYDNERWLSSFLFILWALVLGLRGEHEQASSALRNGLAMRQELGDPIGIAYCLSLLGYVAAQQGRPEQAAWLLGAASPVWEDLGTEPFTAVPGITNLVRETEAGARAALGADLWDATFERAAAYPLEEAATLAGNAGQLALAAAAPGTAGEKPAAGEKGAAGPALLTAREREIADLVAEGLSNRDIAARLVISRRTVDSHVEHIFGKLGISSRVQLAVWLRDHRRHEQARPKARNLVP